ncbi:UDP-glucose/GDP-mannose dehydrogenase family protein [candidate division KSB1 bacterium]|nr:UDP-glucose/GDP-mannose dehydrogenase family protein [candidate division KSB1 bacterium]
MKITVVGTGYVGLVTGACFADTGLDVTCMDIDEFRIDDLKIGILPIYEPGLEELVERNLEKNRLRFTTDIESALTDCEVVFIAVGTPADDDGNSDLHHILNAARDVGKYMQNYMVVVTKATVPVGTAYKVKDVIREELDKRGSGLEFDIASNPEFLKAGAAVMDFLKPDRIVIGIECGKTEAIMRRLYKPFLLNAHPIIFMDITSAEMTKYAANAILATKISFINEIANLCEKVGADINLVRKGIGTDPRIGFDFIYPGIGFGGSCFPRDVRALIHTGDEYDYPMEVLRGVDTVNIRQRSVLFTKVSNYFGDRIKGRNVAIWGLSFKPGTNDMHEAPSIELIDSLLAAGCNIKVYDPKAMNDARQLFGDRITYANEHYEALIDSDCLLIVTEWQEFRFPNFIVMTKLMKNKVIFDGRNIFDPVELEQLGFDYHCLGIRNDNIYVPVKKKVKVHE